MCFILIIVVCFYVDFISSTYISPLIKVSAIDGKGIGIIATNNIKVGTLLVEEKPLFILKTLQIRMTEDMEIERVEKKVQGLNDEEIESFYNLHAYSKRSLNAYSRALDIFRTNAYPTDTDTAGIFPTISRFNSECNPNVHYNYDYDRGIATVYAIRDIESQQEVVNCYIGLFLPRQERQSYLLENFGFECNCCVCEQSGQQLLDSDHRRITLMKLEKKFQLLLKNDSYNKAEAMELITTRIKLIQEENIKEPATLFKIQRYAYKITNDHEWREKYLSSWSLCKGQSKSTM
jgi:hypothetical protein